MSLLPRGVAAQPPLRPLSTRACLHSSLRPAPLCWPPPGPWLGLGGGPPTTSPTTPSRRRRSGRAPFPEGDGRIPSLLLSNSFLTPHLPTPVPLCSLDSVRGKNIQSTFRYITKYLAQWSRINRGLLPPGRAAVAHSAPSALVQRAGRCYQVWLGKPCYAISPSPCPHSFLSCLTTRGSNRFARSGSPASHIEPRPVPTP
jgi:hypothetical protein